MGHKDSSALLRVVSGEISDGQPTKRPWAVVSSAVSILALGKKASAGKQHGGMMPVSEHEELAALQRENKELKDRLEERQHLLERMVPAPVVQDLLQREWSKGKEQPTWQPWQQAGSEANLDKARFLRRENAMDAPRVGMAKAVNYDMVTVFFSDIVGFTNMSQSVEPFEVMSFLHELYSRLDALLSSKYMTLWKVETIGDSYMVAGGLMQVPGRPETPAQSALEVLSFAREALQIAASITMPNGKPCKLRVGLNSGPLTSGVVGSRMPRYCLFGETVNVASRMESTGLPGAIQVSERTWHLLGYDTAVLGNQEAIESGMYWQLRRGVFVKGKGKMTTYILAHPQDHLAESDKSLFLMPSEIRYWGITILLTCCTVATVGSAFLAHCSDKGAMAPL